MLTSGSDTGASGSGSSSATCGGRSGSGTGTTPWRSRLGTLLFLLICAFSVAASWAWEPNDTLTWNLYDSEMNQINGYHLWWTVSGGEIQPAAVLLIGGVHPTPPNCCWDRTGAWNPQPGCECTIWHWPQTASPARYVEAQVGELVCFWLSAYREVGNPLGPAESAWSNEYCTSWASFCEFETRTEMCSCFDCSGLGPLGMAVYPPEAPPDPAGLGMFGGVLDGPGRLMDFGGALEEEP